jgi:penicillin-binding protein 1C
VARAFQPAFFGYKSRTFRPALHAELRYTIVASETARVRGLMSFRFKRALVLLAAITLCAAAAVIAGFVVWNRLPDYRNAIQEQRSLVGTVVLDRDGRILRIFPDSKGRFCLWRDLSSFPEALKEAVIAAEDKRFFHHSGFDAIAILRALFTNATRGRVVSGASTITQQVVRLICPRPRTYRSKVIELAASIKMEMQLSKEQILELYLNLSPLGGGIRGAGLASRVYFGKDVSQIGLAEAATLAALPRSPSRFSPRTQAGRNSLSAERDRILKRMAHLGFIDARQLNLSLNAKLKVHDDRLPLQAPHLVDLVMADRDPVGSVIRTTVDLEMQHSLENVIRSHRIRLRSRGIGQIGALIVSATDGKVLAMVGSFDYGPSGQGYNNAVLARRSAGSTLKPFLYAAALENGYQPFSEIPDTFRTYSTPHGDYLPFNADRRSYGPVSIRTALGNSLNISAVKMARTLGIGELYRLLGRVSVVTEESPSADHYGLGIAIGNMEVSLYNLVQAYTALAAGGIFRPLRTVEPAQSHPVQVVSPESAFIIFDILADPTARVLTFGNPAYFDFGFPVAVKTGTSTSFRDAWMVAYTAKHVIGIWAGNFDGRPSNSASGASVCGPIVKDVVGFLYGGVAPEPLARPSRVREVQLCTASGKRAGPNCPHTVTELTTADAEIELCSQHHHTEYRYLGGPYARWIHRREARLGPSRFRLEPAGDRASPHAGEVGGITVESSRWRGGLESSNIEIVSPHNFDRFVMNRYAPTRILLRAVPQPVVSHITWLVDGMELARTPPPYEFFWNPIQGSHVIYAVTPQHRAATVTIHVE